MKRHIAHEEFNIHATTTGVGEVHGFESGDMASKVGEVFKQMDVRGDGEVCWEDFSAVRTDMQCLVWDEASIECQLCCKLYD